MSAATVTVVRPHADPATIEVHVGRGLPGFQIVGAPSGAEREVRDRVRAATLHLGYDWPLQRITVQVVNGLAVAADLAIIAGILAATDQGNPPTEVPEGHVGLDGRWAA